MIFPDATSPPLYLAVGTTVQISSFATGTPPSFPCAMEAFLGKSRLGKLICEKNHETLNLSLTAKNPVCPSEAELEALMLFSRVCSRIDGHVTPLVIDFRRATPSEEIILKTDGFTKTQDHLFMRQPGKFLRTTLSPASCMEDVYQDPFSIPWNFVPLETDVLQYLDKTSLNKPGIKLLDLGCGFGKNAHFLEKIGLEVYGIDVADSAIKRCREIVAHPEKFKTASVTELPWPDETFDVLLDVGCLHCLSATDRDLALIEIARIMKPDGYLLSRFFKPKNDQWLKEQPFQTEKFGLHYEDLKKVFDGKLQLNILNETEWAYYTEAYKFK